MYVGPVATRLGREEVQMTTYVHAVGVPNIYHWCRNCRKFPKTIGGSTKVRPEGKLCDECREHEKNRTCNVNP